MGQCGGAGTAWNDELGQGWQPLIQSGDLSLHPVRVRAWCYTQGCELGAAVDPLLLNLPAWIGQHAVIGEFGEQ